MINEPLDGAYSADFGTDINANHVFTRGPRELSGLLASDHFFENLKPAEIEKNHSNII